MEIPKVELNIKKIPLIPFWGIFFSCKLLVALQVVSVSCKWLVVEIIVTPTQVGVHCVLLCLVITMDTGLRRYDGFFSDKLLV